nr:ATP synthase F0 subunit 8 [Thylacodes adamsii]
MPQLSPLGWLILYIYFWTGLLWISSIVWWTSKSFYSAPASSLSFLYKWVWC